MAAKVMIPTSTISYCHLYTHGRELTQDRVEDHDALNRGAVYGNLDDVVQHYRHSQNQTLITVEELVNEDEDGACVHLFGESEVRLPQVVSRVVNQPYQGRVVVVLPVERAVLPVGSLTPTAHSCLVILNSKRLFGLGDSLLGKLVGHVLS